MKRMLTILGIHIFTMLTLHTSPLFAAEDSVCKLMQQQYDVKFNSISEMDFSSDINDSFTDEQDTSMIPIDSGVSEEADEILVVSDPFKADGVRWAKWTTIKGINHIWEGGGYITRIIATSDLQSDDEYIHFLNIGRRGWRGYTYTIYSVANTQWNNFFEEAKAAYGEGYSFYLSRDDTYATRVYSTVKRNLFRWSFYNIFTYDNKLFYIDQSWRVRGIIVYRVMPDGTISAVCDIKGPEPSKFIALASLINISTASLIEKRLEGASYGSMGYRGGISERVFDTDLLRPWISLYEMKQGCNQEDKYCKDITTIKSLLNLYGFQDIWSHRERLTLENHLLETQATLAHYYNTKFNIEIRTSNDLAEFVVYKFLNGVLDSYGGSKEAAKRDISDRQKAVSHGVELTFRNFKNWEIGLTPTEQAAWASVLGETNSLIVDHLNDPEKLQISQVFKQVNRFGKTFLMIAAHMNNYEVVKALLNTAIDVNAKTHFPRNGEGYWDDDFIKRFNRTALMYAAENASPEVIKILLANGADPTIRDSEGNSVQSYLDKNPRIDKELKIKGIIEVARSVKGELSQEVDCKESNSDLQIAICESQTLTLYDREMSKNYNLYLESAKNISQVKKSHFDWLKILELRCNSDNEKSVYLVCLAQQYRARGRYYENILTAIKMVN